MKRHFCVAGIFLVAVSLTGVFGAIGLGSPAGAAGTDSSLATEAGSMRKVRVPAAGVALEYPSQWVRTAVSEKQARKILKAFKKSNPKVANLLDEDDIIDSARNSKFRAVDVEAQLSGGAGGVVDVQVLDSGLPPMAVFRASYDATLKTTGGELINLFETRVSKRDALRSDARITLKDPDGNPVSLRISQLLIDRGLTTSLVSVGAPDGENADAMIDAILVTVRKI